MDEGVLKNWILAKISSGEAGSYDELYGGGKFGSYADHPRESIPIGNGQSTTAAGRYQFLSSTWDDEAKRLGLKDFSPASQDSAAWDLAQRTYQQQTGKELLDDAASGAVDWHALSGQWTSLSGQGTPSGDHGDAMEASPTNAKQVSDDADGSEAGGMKNLALLQSLAPHLTFTPVDYDPFKIGASNVT